MTTRSPLACLATIALTGLNSRADTVIERRVELPKATSVPVVNKRYQVVTKGGEVTINPPQAVVYLEGDFLSHYPLLSMVEKSALPGILARLHDSFIPLENGVPAVRCGTFLRWRCLPCAEHRAAVERARA